MIRERTSGLDGAALVLQPVERADEVPVHHKQATEDGVFETLDKEAELDRIVVIRRHQRLEGDRIELLAFDDGVDPRAEGEIAVLVGEIDAVGRGKADVGGLGIDRREEGREDGHDEQRDDQDEADHAGQRALQPAPDERDIAFMPAAMQFSLCDRGQGIFGRGDQGHAPAPRRMRGSSRTSSMSAMMLPTISVTESTSMKVAVT